MGLATNGLYFSNFKGISVFQEQIMRYINTWSKSHKDPIPQKLIIAEMVKLGNKNTTVMNSLNTLLRKGYIRRAYILGSNTSTSYVQIRTV